MKDVQPDWRHLSDILQELTSFDHRFRHAFNDSFEIKSAITNAACSGEVAVRGRRYNDFSLQNSAFERVEKYLGPKADVDISLNRIHIPDDGAVLRSITIPDSGFGRFTDAQADLRGVEKWIFENSLPPCWRKRRPKKVRHRGAAHRLSMLGTPSAKRLSASWKRTANSISKSRTGTFRRAWNRNCWNSAARS
jgi:hypothetical protein